MPWGWRNRGAPIFGLGPDRVKFRVGERHTNHTGADGGAFQSLLLDRYFQLLHREVGGLQGERGEACETVRMGRAELGQLLVLDLDDLGGKVAIPAIPERIDRQHFHVDGLRIDGRQPLIEIDDDFVGAAHLRQQGLGAFLAEQRVGLTDQAMRVDVDGFRPVCR